MDLTGYLASGSVFFYAGVAVPVVTGVTYVAGKVKFSTFCLAVSVSEALWVIDNLRRGLDNAAVIDSISAVSWLLIWLWWRHDGTTRRWLGGLTRRSHKVERPTQDAS